MATTKQRVELLRQVYAAIAEAVQALQSEEKYKGKLQRLEKTIKSQEQKITELQLIIIGHERLNGKRVQICPECFGAGAYLVGGEPEECDQCDSLGVIEKV